MDEEMNVLVTGGTGFIGSALVRQLLKEGNRVGILVRDETKLDASLRKNVEMYKADISNLASLELFYASIKDNIDIMFHLAACIDYKATKEKLFQTNVGGTLNLLNLIVKHRIKKFVFVSSIEAIGPIKKEDIPADETYSCQPINFYGESKLEAEKQVIRFGDKREIGTVILRLGNVYGPGSLSFISSISNAILSRNKEWLYSNRNRYLWHPGYIEDVIDGIMKATATKKSNDIYILAGAEHVTVGVLSQLISQELGIDIRTLELNKVKKLYLNLRRKVRKFRYCFKNGNKKRTYWVYSIEKAKKELGYSPKVSLRNGIAKTIEWAKKEGLLTK